MIINTRNKKQKLRIKKKVKCLAEIQNDKLEGKEPFNPSKNTKKIHFHNYSEKSMQVFKHGAIEADSVYGIKGVYFLFNANMHVVYIGESKDCTGRIKEHFDNPNKEFKYYKILKVSHSDLARKQIEKKLIKQFCPKYNQVHNRFDTKYFNK
jgi:hypothetical protein